MTSLNETGVAGQESGVSKTARRQASAEAVSRFLPVAFSAFVLLILSTGTVEAAGEPLPVFRASELLPGQKLSGPAYRVEQRVRNNGFLNIYSVTVDGKSYAVAGDALMRIRLRELAALQRMAQISRTNIYKEAVKKGAMGPLRTAKGLITSPIQTVKGIGSGVATFFKGVGHSIFGGASEQEEGVLKTALGFDIAKRKFAYKFGIDPYTSFAPVKERLNEISWAGVAGGLTVSAAFSAIPGPAGGAMSGTKTGDAMNRLIRDNTPAQLKKANAAKLRLMGVHASVAELFLEHPKYSPTQKTHIVEALALVGAGGRQEFIQRAILVQDETMAFFMRRWAEMFSAYHRRVAQIGRFVRLGMAPFAQRPDGVLVGLFPIDHLAWTDWVARRHASNLKTIRGIPGITGGEIWIAGTISPKARKELEYENWVVKERVRSILGLE